MKWLSRDIAAPGPYLLLCVTERQYIKAMKHLNVTPLGKWVSHDANATTHILTSSKMEMTCIVCMPVVKKGNSEIFGLLVHEAVHVWQAYVEDIGENKPGIEQMAYGIQAISQALISSYMRLSKRQKHENT